MAAISAGAAPQVKDMGAKPPVQIRRHGGPGPVVPSGSGVAVDRQAVPIPDNGHKGLVYLRRGGDGGVADGEIKDIVLPHNGSLPQPVFEQFPDAGTLGAEAVHHFVDHGKPPFLSGVERKNYGIQSTTDGGDCQTFSKGRGDRFPAIPPVSHGL